MPFPFATKSLIPKSSNLLQPIRATYQYDIFPFFKSFKHINRQRCKLLYGLPVLVYLPHTLISIYTLYGMSILRHNLLLSGVFFSALPVDRGGHIDVRSDPTLPLRHGPKTRYGWAANPFPTGTFTPQDTPSFARRDNVLLKHAVFASLGAAG